MGPGKVGSLILRQNKEPGVDDGDAVSVTRRRRRRREEEEEKKKKKEETWRLFQVFLRLRCGYQAMTLY
jgi:hypothetical protein